MIAKILLIDNKNSNFKMKNFFKIKFLNYAKIYIEKIIG